MKNSFGKKAFEKQLVDVRQSYRLLYLYQEQVMEIIRFIGKELNFDYEKGEQYFMKPGQKTWSKFKLDNWAWDYLLLNNHVFVFKPKNYGSFKDVRLMINIVSDTGCYDVENIDKRDVNNYNDVEDSATQIHLILKTKGISWKDTYQFKYVSKNTTEPLNNTDDLKRKGEILIGKKYDLSDFMNEESTLEQLNDFEKFCFDNKIVLRPNVKS